MSDRVRTFVPGHITGFFSVHTHPDPLQAGSRGAGITISDGVTVTVEPAEETTVTVDDRPFDIDPVLRLLDRIDVSASISVVSDLPLGAGFGISGAITLGTAFAANELFDLHCTQNELIAASHIAEVESETGMGDVVAQARGGVPIRIEPGGPDHNHIDGIVGTGRIEYQTFGEVSTSAVLSGDTDRLNKAGERALTALCDQPSLTTLLRESKRFSRESDLLTPSVAEVIDTLEENGDDASMAMLGDTVFAYGTALSDAGFDPDVCSINVGGACIL